MKAILLVLFFALVFARLPVLPHEFQFQAWMQQYNKNYPTQIEYATRLANFVATTKRVAELNAQSKALNSTATFAVNKFADLSPEEFSARLGMKGYVPKFDETREVVPPLPKAADAADWRTKNKLTPVKDQAQCGSCWAFSCTESIESVYMINKNLNGAQMPPLAPQQIVDCDRNDAGCNGGDLPTCYRYVISAGLEKESDYPYRAKDETCKSDSSKDFLKISNFKYVIPEGSRDENQMASFLASSSPISIIVDASSWSSYKSGILKAAQCGHSLDHAVQAVGYDTGNGYWIVRNSWGSDWGEKGYIRLQFGGNTCGLTSEVTVPVL